MAAAPLKILSTLEVARRLGMTTASIRRFAIAGDLVGTKVGQRSWAFNPRDVEAFARKRERDRDPQKGGRPKRGRPENE